MLTIVAGAQEYTIEYRCTGCANTQPMSGPKCTSCGLGQYEPGWPQGSQTMAKQELDQDIADELEGLRELRDQLQERVRQLEGREQTLRNLLADGCRMADTVGLVGTREQARAARRYLEKVAKETGHAHLVPVVPCTGAAAVWCPVHGNCSCLDRDDLSSPECSLHGARSTHALEEE